MSSYVYMKILESRPRRYERGIGLLSLGRWNRTISRLVADNIEPGGLVLDIGCGTGMAAVLAARAGARVTGFDISPAMLAVARDKVAEASLTDRIELIEMGIAGIDRFADASFDRVISTLVFSELSADEQGYALEHALRVLVPGGRLVIADEARPRTAGKRLLHALVAVTFALTQTTTRAVEGLAERVREAGFTVEREERTALDSLLYLVATKGERR
jgi:demethylmenaquinone methyltransferase/2-methoxy-6-polyprenyl-1,4-benzoquinol methylase